MPIETRVRILAPLVRGRRGTHRDVLEAIQKAGFVRARIDGVAYPLDEIPPPAPQKMHDIEAVVDRIIIRDGIDARLGESVRLAARHGDGVVLVLYQLKTGARNEERGTRSEDEWQERLLNTRYACPRCGTSVGEIEPRTFSFNSPYGACATCHGLGVTSDEDLAGRVDASAAGDGSGSFGETAQRGECTDSGG